MKKILGIASVVIVLLSSCELPVSSYSSLGMIRSPSVNVNTLEEAKIFVADNIKYKTDMEVHGVNEYWQAPVETIERGTGDCEDMAILLGWLADSLGHEVKILTIKYEGYNHCLLTIDGKWCNPQTISVSSLRIDGKFMGTVLALDRCDYNSSNSIVTRVYSLEEALDRCLGYGSN